MSKESLDLPPVLAAPPRRSRRHRITVAIAAHLAVVLGVAGVVALIHGSGASAGLAATLISPGDGRGTLAAFSPDGKTLAAGDGDGNSYLWNVATRHLAATLTNPGSLGVPSVAFRPDGRMLATGDAPGDDVLWDVSGGR